MHWWGLCAAGCCLGKAWPPWVGCRLVPQPRRPFSAQLLCEHKVDFCTVDGSEETAAPTSWGSEMLGWGGLSCRRLVLCERGAVKPVGTRACGVRSCCRAGSGSASWGPVGFRFSGFCRTEQSGGRAPCSQSVAGLLSSKFGNRVSAHLRDLNQTCSQVCCGSGFFFNTMI